MLWTESGRAGPGPGTSLGGVDEVEIARIGPDEWREVRLASRSDAPGAFGARYADWVDAAEDRWRRRLADVPFTGIARSGVAPVGVAPGWPADAPPERRMRHGGA